MAMPDRCPRCGRGSAVESVGGDLPVQATHAEGCWEWGPKHYSCAVREIERLRARVAELEDHQAERDRILGARVREIASQHDAHLDPYGFAEEMALEEFRVAVRGARVARRDASHGSRIALGMHASKLGAVRVLARIIRAIRAEREFALAVMRAMEESDD